MEACQIRSQNWISAEEEYVAPVSENDRYKPETYIALIPKDEKLIDSITKDRNFAYYQLGLIYKEKFKEYDLAKDRLRGSYFHLIQKKD